MIQNKVPPKLGEPGSFLIPCNFSKAFSCNALAYLGASINLMPYSLYAKLSLKTLKPTKMSVRLADRSFQHPIGIVENMLVKVGKFTFPVDFVILKMEEDSKVPLILGRPFLHTTDAVIRVKQKQLNLGVRTEQMTFHIDFAMKHSYSNDDTCFSIDIIDEILEEDFDALLDEGSKILHSIKGTILKERLFAEFDEFMAMTTDENSESDSKTEEPPFENITFNTDYKITTSLEEPPSDLDIKPLPDNLEYVFLEEHSFLRVIISSQLSEQNKNKLISILKRHKCMLVIFHDMIEESIEVFMDDFSVFGNSFDNCLKNIDKMLQRCKDANLVLNWEECHLMVKEGIVLGHKVSGAGLEVDKAKIDVFSKLLPPTNVKGIRSIENVVADHLSRIDNDETSNDSDVDDNFPRETFMEITTNDIPWFVDFVNYLVGDVIPKGMTYQQKNKFFSDLKTTFGKILTFSKEQLSDASIEIKAYTQGLKKVEAQLVAHQQGQLWYEEKIRFMKIDLDDKTDVLTYHKKLLAEAQKEKEDLKAKVEKWHNSSKNLGKLLNTQMSANDKFGLGYGDHRYDGILSYENEVLQSVFMNKESELEKQPLYDRFVTAGGMHAVPPPMTGNYMPSGPDVEIDYSQFTYGPKQTQPSKSETQTSEFDTCESNISIETPELVSEPVVNESNVACQPKVWSDAPIIEEYESDSGDEYVSIPTKEQETPSFANQQVKNPRETAKNHLTHSKNPKVDKKELGYGFPARACFVCRILNHLIRDCDFHEKRMAKQAELCRSLVWDLYSLCKTIANLNKSKSTM
ncbi:reverse transcriptase domain-containing protein [Tanacetum coccineum]